MGFGIKTYFRKVWKKSKKIINFPKTIRNKRANTLGQVYMAAHPLRIQVIDRIKETISTGMEISQYSAIHEYVKKRKPKILFEFGGGASTAVLCAAYRELVDEEGFRGKVYSFEDVPKYIDHTRSILCSSDLKYCELVHRKKVENILSWSEKKIWGFSYEKLVDVTPSAILIDGPFEAREKDSPRGVCLDGLLWLANRNFVSVDILVEGKKKTVDALQSILPGKQLQIIEGTGIHIVYGVTPSDLLLGDVKVQPQRIFEN